MRAIILALALIVGIGPTMAQQKFKATGDFPGDIKRAMGTPGAPGSPSERDPKAALPCMDISVITKLTPQNIVPTWKGCEQEGVGKLVSDTSRALDSAKTFTGSASGAGASLGDNDAINCLTPALALFKAMQDVPGTPEVPAVLNPDGSVKTPAVPAAPAQEAGPILLYQKYREFTLAGALTSCQTWFNGPINATLSAGLAGAAGLAGGAALLVPK